MRGTDRVSGELIVNPCGPFCIIAGRAAAVSGPQSRRRCRRSPGTIEHGQLGFVKISPVINFDRLGKA
jgi:hypothetical protein